MYAPGIETLFCMEMESSAFRAFFAGSGFTIQCPPDSHHYSESSRIKHLLNSASALLRPGFSF